ncbi:MAG: hypothetical protein LKJ76_08490 [Lachnospiraceae bacterium]|jgi:hypothetical protein|nr:hypothetical protein [Lachnospiraceae bacterium]
MSNALLTKEQMELILQNQYTAAVSPHRILFTLTFKQLVVREAAKGRKSLQILSDAGYDVDMLGTTRCYGIIRRIKAEARSPRGLCEPKGNTKAERARKFAEENLANKSQDAAIRELQKQMVLLQAQIEALKKTTLLRP